MVNFLHAGKIVLGHHDDWMPPMTRPMNTPAALGSVREELARVAPATTLIESGYLEGLPLLG